MNNDAAFMNQMVLGSKASIQCAHASIGEKQHTPRLNAKYNVNDVNLTWPGLDAGWQSSPAEGWYDNLDAYSWGWGEGRRWAEHR